MKGCIYGTTLITIQIACVGLAHAEPWPHRSLITPPKEWLKVYEKLERFPLDVPRPPAGAGVYTHFRTEATQDLTEAL